MIDEIKKILRRESESEKCALASDPRTPRSKLLELANSKNISVKIRIAHRLEIDPEIIEVLVSNENLNVRYALINKEDCGSIPSIYLEKLTEDPIEFVREKAKEILAERTQEGIYSFSFF